MLEVDYVRSGYRAVGLWAADQWSESPECVEQQLWHLFLTGNRRRVLSKWLGDSGREDSVQTAVDVYREHTPSISLVSGAAEVLRILGKHFKLGLVTDGYSMTQRRKIEALSLESLISTIVVSDEIGGRSTWKPSPAPLLEACARLDTTPSRAVYIGDNPHKDFFGARVAGLASVRLRLSAGLHSTCEPQCKEAQPDGVVAELREVPHAVDSLELNVVRARECRSSYFTFDPSPGHCTIDEVSYREDGTAAVAVIQPDLPTPEDARDA